MDIEYSVIYWTLWAGIASALATGLGALPVHFLRRDSRLVQSFTIAFAAGMMLSASAFSLIQEGINLQSRYPFAPYSVIGGLLLGAAFFWITEKFLHNQSHYFEKARDQMGVQGIMIFLAMFIHSIPEGIAIGVGFATGDLGFGIMMALAISVHNIPEGIAISLPLHNRGVSTKKCAGISVLSSLPQPLLAVPSALAVHFFDPLLPAGLGFAAGAMIYLVVAEMLPEAMEKGGKVYTAWGCMIGLAFMLSFSVMITSMFSQ